MRRSIVKSFRIYDREVTIEDARESAALQNNIALNGQFYTKPNLDILYEVDYGGGPILKEHGGKANKTELDNFLGALDVIKSEGLSLCIRGHKMLERGVCS